MPQSSRVVHVLLALHSTPRHGYAIKRAVFELSGGSIDLEPGGLYRMLGRLEDQGLLKPVSAPQDEDSQGPPRNYYSLSDLGRRTLTQEVARLGDFMAHPEVVALLRTLPH